MPSVKAEAGSEVVLLHEMVHLHRLFNAGQNLFTEITIAEILYCYAIVF